MILLVPVPDILSEKMAHGVISHTGSYQPTTNSMRLQGSRYAKPLI